MLETRKRESECFTFVAASCCTNVISIVFSALALCHTSVSAAAAAQNWGRQTAECSCGGRSSEILALRRYIVRHNSHADALDKGLMARVLRQKAWYLLPPRITCQAVNSVVRLLGSHTIRTGSWVAEFVIVIDVVPQATHTLFWLLLSVSSFLHRIFHLFCVYFYLYCGTVVDHVTESNLRAFLRFRRV